MTDDKIPVSWEKVAISEICSINPRLDKTLFSDDLKVAFVPMPAVEAETGKVDVSESKSFEKVKKGYTAFQQDDVLFAKITPCMENGKMAVVPALINDIGFGSTEFHVLRALAGILPKFIYYYVSSKRFRHDAEHNMTGAVGQRRVPTPYLEKSKVVLPPTNEQYRIVAKIEELFSEIDKGVESLETAKAQLQVYRQALLRHAFEGKLTAQWRADNPDKVVPAEQLLEQIKQAREERYQQQLADWQTAVEKWEFGGKECKKPRKPPKLNDFVNLSDELLEKYDVLPRDWFYLRAEEISDFITKGTTPSKNKLFAGSGDIPFIKVYNLTKTGALDFSVDPTFTDEETHNDFLARSKTYPNDVLMNIVGPPLGKVSIVPNFYQEWNINQAIVRFRPICLKPRYLVYYLMAEQTVRRISSQAKATAGQFNLTLEICRNALVPICSLVEQDQILEQIEQKMTEIEATEKEVHRSIQQAELIKQSILKKAFSGQLVPQDPTDEPASKLLERIKAEKAEREAQAKANKTKKPRTPRKTKAATP